MRRALICLLCLIPLPLAAAENCPVPKNLSFLVDNEIRRDAVGFTEGLEVHDGVLYESTGDIFGATRINRIDPKTGHVTAVMNAGKSYFGEGLTFFDGKLYQMTYREHRVFVFDKEMRKQKELSNPREGWGLTHDDKELIASDGSSHIYYLSPADFSTRRSLAVTYRDRALPNINELEFVQGAIWANVFESWSVVRISPATGCVEARADLRSLQGLMTAADRKTIGADDNFVLNGIAYDPGSKKFFITGKDWPMLYSGRFVEGN
ncbi:MAG TPA: glutaminyl-peptide cyclotransferase [Rhizomicrobium sp.]|nr:glutaminyl-peptide cyclotransferase [Rhizomicrobium sp.]